MPDYVVHERNRALTASTAKTIIQIVAPSTRRLRIVEVGVSFDGVTAADQPVDVDLIRQTTAGTMTAFGAPLLVDPAETAAIASAHNVNATAEPTAADIIGAWQVTPNGGLWLVQWTPDEAPLVAASGRIGLRCTPGASATSVNATGYVRFRE